jgi:hypothetical protein
LVTYAVNCAAARDIDAVGVAYYVARTLAELELEDSRLRARASSGRSGFGKGHKDRARRALKRQLRTEEAHEDIAWSERQAQAALVRELFGPAGAVTIPSSVLAWDDGTVRRIAQALHEEQRVGDLPILADALEEAGCTDGAILAHCRGPGPHVRDCWVVDLILAKP